MSLTAEARANHNRYEEADASIRMVVDDAFRAAQETIKSFGRSTAVDDRAETLIAALTAYVLDSRGDDEPRIELRQHKTDRDRREWCVIYEGEAFPFGADELGHELATYAAGRMEKDRYVADPDFDE